MNWNTYKQLSSDEREEFQYRFDEGPDTTNWYMTMGIIGTGLVFFHVFLFYVISISTNETLLQFREIIGQTVAADLKVIMVIMWLVIVGLFYNAVMNIIYGIRRNRWLKKHNIKLGWKDLWK